MRVRLDGDPGAALAAAAPFFASDPFSANVIAVVTARLVAGTGVTGSDYLWATVADTAGAVVGVAMHTPPFPLFLSRMPPEAAAALASRLADAERDLPGVNGECASTAAFAETWCARTGQDSTVRTAMRMYRLDKLAPPRDVPGGSEVALAPGDVEFVTAYFSDFNDEAERRAPVDDLAAIVERRIAAGELHVWRDGGVPVSIAGVSRAAAGVARVGPVYTPPRHRRHGYGAAVTAAATAAALAAGADHVVLYADLANPTSNSIYQAIGYRPDHDADERSFRRRER